MVFKWKPKKFDKFGSKKIAVDNKILYDFNQSIKLYILITDTCSLPAFFSVSSSSMLLWCERQNERENTKLQLIKCKKTQNLEKSPTKMINWAIKIMRG